MAFAAPPLSLPGPATWWQDPKVRARLIAAAVLFAAYVTGLAYGSWTRVCAAERCPSISRLIGGPGPQQTSKVYAADGRLITELGLERRTVLALNEIPLAVRQAFIATEDKRFYSHHGIDYWRIFGALKANIVTLGRSQGASTISMQLARNIFPEEISREKKITRKIKEARVAIEIEDNFPKDTILQLYLNQIDLGSGAHGVAAAAQIYFGKSARQLNVAEAAMLAALPKAPAFYNPRAHPDRAVRRRNVVLSLMRDQEYITPEEAELWKAYPLVLTSNRTNYGDVAPYFVEWLRSTQLEPRFGRQLYEGGLRVYTTLDLEMQQAAERALTSRLDAVAAQGLRRHDARHDPDAAIAVPVAQPLHHQARHGARAGDGGRRSPPLRHHDAAPPLSVAPHRRQRRAADRDRRGLHRLRDARHSRRAGRHPAGGGPAGQHPVATAGAARAGHGSRALVAAARHDEGRDALSAGHGTLALRHGGGRRRRAQRSDGREDRDDGRLHRCLVRGLHPRARGGALGGLRLAAAHHEQRRWRPHRGAGLDDVHARRVRPPPHAD